MKRENHASCFQLGSRSSLHPEEISPLYGFSFHSYSDRWDKEPESWASSLNLPLCKRPFPIACALHANLEGKRFGREYEPTLLPAPQSRLQKSQKGHQDINTSSTNMGLRAPGGAWTQVSLGCTLHLKLWPKLRRFQHLFLQGEA